MTPQNREPTDAETAQRIRWQEAARRLTIALGERGWSPTALANELGLGSTHITDFLAGRKDKLKLRTIQAIAGKLKVPASWLANDSASDHLDPFAQGAGNDAGRSASADAWPDDATGVTSEGIPESAMRVPVPPPQHRMLPVHGLAAGSLNGAPHLSDEPIDWKPCPPGLANARGAYMLQVSGESMVPRFFPGEPIYIHPYQAVKADDYAVIQIQRFEGAPVETWVKRFINFNAEGDAIVLQHNPESKMTFKRKWIKAIHRVVPPAELFG